ncbi:MAG: HD domain-containing protein [Elusimicrobia bacterium]|nr:HD domain-containing protein [Elusimicrobiota bacterium]
MAPPVCLPRRAAQLLRAAAAALPGPCYLVGGALRDVWLGRPLLDLDLAARGARAGAGALARRLRAACVPLDEEQGVYRLVLRGAGPIAQLDISELQGADIIQDLARRDFTVDALALPIAPGLRAEISPAALLDPRGGLADLAAGRLRCESEEILKADPLRLLRAFRLGAQLGFSIEPATLRLLRRLRSRVRQPAAERIGAELSLLLSEPGCGRWIRLMDETGVLTALFEDLEPSRQCAQCYYGKGGVLEHTLAVIDRLDFMLANLDRVFPDTARPLSEALGGRLRPGPSRAALMLAALLHDVSKPETARRIGGRLRFFGHDEAGARRAARLLKDLRFPNDTVDTVSAVIAQHLRPGNLAAGGALTDKAVYRLFRDLGEQALPLLLVCWADHASYLPARRLEPLLKAAAEPPDGAGLAAVRPAEARKTVSHLRVVGELLRRHFESGRKTVPERMLDGHAVMRLLNIPPGPRVGAVLERLREAQAEGLVRSRRQAVEFVKRLQ